MLTVFADNLLPIFLAAAAGYVLAARLQVDVRPLAQVAFLVLSPCLVYDAIVATALPADAVLRMVVFTLISLSGLAALAAIVAWWRRWPRPLTAAVVLVVLLPNAGNIGLSANLFAFGEKGLAQATVFFVTAAIVTYTAGVFLASLGRASLADALRGVFKVPAIWAVLLAVVAVQTGWSLPFPLARTVDLLGKACIPAFLIILGMQLHGKGLGTPLVPLVAAAGIRLVGGPLWGMLLARLVGLDGPAHQAAVLQSAMPSAVVCIVLATQYDVEPAFATSVVFFTTILSPLTLTPLLAMLGAG
jgi:predicted permease